MGEQFENDYSTLLNGAINDSVTTITVDTPPDMTGAFRIKIDDEIIYVTTVSGNDFTSCVRGAEGTVAASHSDNATVTHVLTAGALEQVFAQGVSPAFIYPPYTDIGVAPTTSEALPTSGGAIVFPFNVPTQFKLRAYKIHSRDTANARAAEARLYVYNEATSTLDFVTGTDATFSFTPTTASDRIATISASLVTLPPGTYWLCIRNTSGSQTFSVGYGALAGTYYNQNVTNSVQTIGALGATLTQTGWSGQARTYGVALSNNSGGFGA